MPRFRLLLMAFVLIGYLLQVPIAATGSHPDAATGPSRPNVIVIMLDDVASMDGRLLLALPEIRQVFLEHGVSFSDFHVETSLCCPGRAGFLTGQHTNHHGVVRNDARLFRPGMTLATQLHGLGYYTVL